MSTIKKLESIKQQAIVKALAYEAALSQNDNTAMNTAIAGLKEVEKEYKKESFDEFIKMIRTTENPVLTAITTLQREVLKHREIREEGVLTGIELYITDEKVSMAKVFDRLGIANSWSALAAKLNYMYTLRAALDQGIEGEAFQKLKGNYMLAEEVKKALDGETPTSNTKMLTYLQDVLDAMIFVARDDGKNKYRVLTKDVNALEKWHTSKDRRVIGGTDAAGDKAFDSYVTEVVHCIVTGTGYRMTGKNINGSRPDPKHIKIDLVLTAAPAEEADEPEEVASKEVKRPSKKSSKKAPKKEESVEVPVPAPAAEEAKA